VLQSIGSNIEAVFYAESNHEVTLKNGPYEGCGELLGADFAGFDNVDSMSI